MGMFASCEDAKSMKERIEEITCPECHTKAGIEVFLKDGHTVGDSVCDFCNYVLPDRSPVDQTWEVEE